MNENQIAIQLVEITEIKKPEKIVVFQNTGKNAANRKPIELHIGDNLSLIDKAFEGDLTIDQIKSKSKMVLNNERELGVGEELFAAFSSPNGRSARAGITRMCLSLQKCVPQAPK